MIENANHSVHNKIKHRCISHLPEDQVLAILQELDRNQSRVPTETANTQRTNNFQSSVPQRNTWNGQQVIQRQSTQKRLATQDESPIRRFVKDPQVGKLNYELVTTWYQKLALQSALERASGGTTDQQGSQHLRHNTVVVKR